MTFTSLVPAFLLAVLPLCGAGAWPWVQTAAHLLLAAAVVGRLWGGPRTGLPRPALWAAAFYVLWSLLRFALSPYPHSAARGLLNDLAGLAFLFLSSGGDGPARARIRAGLVAGASAAAFSALPGALARLAGGLAPSGAMVNPNVLASYLVLTAPMAFLWWRERFRGGTPAAVFGAAAAVILLAAGSRGAWGAAAFSAVLFFVTAGRRWAWIGGLAAAGAAAAFLAVDADRLAWWRSAWSMAAGSSFLGVGPGAFGEAYPIFRAEALGQNTLFAHNVLLEVLAERGAPGLAAFAVLLWALASGAAGRWAAAGPAFRAAAAGAAGFLVAGLFNAGFSFPAGAWAFWALAGGLSPEPRPAPAPPSPFVRSLLSVLVLVPAVFSYALFQAEECRDRARDLLTRGDVPAGEAVLKKGLRWNPREPELYALRAAASGLRGDWTGALPDAVRAYGLAPGSARFRAEAGEIALRSGDRERAASCYRDAVRLLPLNKGYRARLEELLHGEG